ncbi:hypothetical protein I4641_16295 [Waterburya agarophytonicola K14]|uniref:ATP-grasp domain-containing protein n=1 Tax=Waterburya agarophytonicola KI4 TaxID=2874699 RepID=A0A964BTQ1_9CYAN|nr:hypothetical protein [Waterburya agarophytonicola]MCC0178537.1 hypothetical protein [Waterburya agarophytonicola KI4]
MVQEKIQLQMLKDITNKYGIEIHLFKDNPIIHLQKGNYQKFIHGFQFELNSDSVSTICKDKGAISIILDFHQIPHVEHRTFSLSSQKTSINESLWTSIQNFAQKYNFDVVCKPNNGFSGQDVYHAHSQRELEKTVHKLLSIYSEFCISPFYKAEFEYRVIVINDRPELIWCKECLALVGDGHSRLKTLFSNYISLLDTQKIAKLFKDFDHSILTSDRVLAYGEKFNLKWKHNEALGSTVSLHNNIDQDKKDKISNLALLTARKLNLFFASIDILDCNDEFKVLEAHTAVTMGPVIRNCGEEGYQKTKEVYDKVVRYMFDID